MVARSVCRLVYQPSTPEIYLFYNLTVCYTDKAPNFFKANYLVNYLILSN